MYNAALYDKNESGLWILILLFILVLICLIFMAFYQNLGTL